MTVGNALGPVVAGLDRAAIPFMVVGSFASSLHGEIRSTQDLDMVIDPTRDSLDAFVARLDERFYADRDVARDALLRRSMFNVIDGDTGWKLDLVICKRRPFSQTELARRIPAEIDGVPVFVATAEDTVIAKLEWAKLGGGSARQLDDVRRLLGVRGDTLDRAYVVRWVGELGLDAEWALASAAA